MYTLRVLLSVFGVFRTLTVLLFLFDVGNLKEHPSIKEYVVVDDDIKEYSSKDIPHLRLVDSKVGFR